MATLVFIITILITSTIGFFQHGFIEKYYFSPYRIRHYSEHYRFLSHAFVHAGLLHLGLNLFALYSFGIILEEFYFPQIYGEKWGRVMFIILFTGGIYASSLWEYLMYNNKPEYASLGVSGSVSAIIFSYIIINPNSEIGFFFIPIKGWIAGLLLLLLSYFLLHKKRRGIYHDNISHESHYWGAIFGILFIVITKFSIAKKFISVIINSF